jgi:hypothetical protein
MPAWIAGIQVHGMRPETSMSVWIPALHAGMTESKTRIKTDRGPRPLVFSKEEDSKVTKRRKFVLRWDRFYSSWPSGATCMGSRLYFDNVRSRDLAPCCPYRMLLSSFRRRGILCEYLGPRQVLGFVGERIERRLLIDKNLLVKNPRFFLIEKPNRYTVVPLFL